MRGKEGRGDEGREGKGEGKGKGLKKRASRWRRVLVKRRLKKGTVN